MRIINMRTLTKVYKKTWTDDSTWIINTPSKAIKEYMFYIQETGHFYCKPGYYTLHENMDSFFVLLTLDGEGKYTYKNTEYTIHKNQLIFADCNERHIYETEPNKNWEFIWFHFNGITARGFYNQYKKKNPTILHLEEHTAFLDIMNDILEMNRTKSMYTEILSNTLVTDFLTEVLVYSGSIISIDNMAPEYILDAIYDIDIHFKDNLSLSHFEETLNISKYYFIKEFKKYTGFTPNEYIQMTRINNAKKLLMYSSLNINMISEECGFQNVGHFINTFKEKTQITPLQYRKRHSKTITKN